MKLSYVIGLSTMLISVVMLGTVLWIKTVSPKAIITDVSGKIHRITIEIARTPEEHQYGLMGRTHLKQDHGMLFMFDAEKVRSFWMKNTLIPLDIIFIDHNQKIVGIIESAEPQSLKLLSVDQPSLFALEVRGGWCKRNQVTIGRLVDFENVTTPKITT